MSSYEEAKQKKRLAGDLEKNEENKIATRRHIENLLGNLKAIRTEENQLYDSLPQTMKDLIAGAEKVNIFDQSETGGNSQSAYFRFITSCLPTSETITEFTTFSKC